MMLQPAILLAADLQAARPVQLFPAYDLRRRPMSVVYLPDLYRAPKLHSFVGFMMARFGDAG